MSECLNVGHLDHDHLSYDGKTLVTAQAVHDISYISLQGKNGKMHF